MSNSPVDSVSGAPRVWLRLEGVAVAALAVWLYARGDHSWWLFGALLFVPDLCFLGYTAGPRIGALAYNVMHSYLGPLLVAAGALLAGETLYGQPFAITLIWAAHIGMDRALGYGLKYDTGFAHTHLGLLRGGRSNTN